MKGILYVLFTRNYEPRFSKYLHVIEKKICLLFKNFHTLKYLISNGMHMAQMCRSEEESPKALFPNINNKGTIKPISGPEMYHGHGSFIKSNIP